MYHNYCHETILLSRLVRHDKNNKKPSDSILPEESHLRQCEWKQKFREAFKTPCSEYSVQSTTSIRYNRTLKRLPNGQNIDCHRQWQTQTIGSIFLQKLSGNFYRKWAWGKEQSCPSSTPFRLKTSHLLEVSPSPGETNTITENLNFCRPQTRNASSQPNSNFPPMEVNISLMFPIRPFPMFFLSVCFHAALFRYKYPY